ncbi:MAG: hypothetical protein GEU98_08155 [Pseudonocardiaceae bacterium]|nr:hypothetical protein [Pseudonocardiaceae bacterium]
MRRLCARTLVVVGGAIAGTAAAWVIASGSATAAEPALTGPSPSASAAQVPIATQASSATQAIDVNDAASADAAEAASKPAAETGGTVTGTLQQASNAPDRHNPAATDQSRDTVSGSPGQLRRHVGDTADTVRGMAGQPDQAREVIRDGAPQQPVDHGERLENQVSDWFRTAPKPGIDPELDPELIGGVVEDGPGQLPAPELPGLPDGTGPIGAPQQPVKNNQTPQEKHRPAMVASSAADRATTNGVTSLGTPVPHRPSQPEPMVPFDPTSTPITLTSMSGSGGYQHSEFKPGSLQPGTPDALGEPRTRAPRPGSHHAPQTAGPQPGTTPD